MIASQAPLLVTLGDPAGIGPEITVKAWSVLRHDRQHSFAVLAPYDLFARKLSEFDLPRPHLIAAPSEVNDVFKAALPILHMAPGDTIIEGKPNAANTSLITGSIERGVKHCLAGTTDAIITNPIAKEVLYKSGFKHPGHTEFLGELTKETKAPYARGPLMMLANSELRVALVTVHQSVAKAAKSITISKIMERAKILHGALKCDLGIKNPRIALAALNPHAGEGGAMGDEEINIINPAAEKLRAGGMNITNALPPDTMFHAEARSNYDAALCMYHDQGLIPVKTIDFHNTVNITMGLPIVRTSPDHGTAFDIAGKGIARPDSLIAAIKLARKIADYRSANA